MAVLSGGARSRRRPAGIRHFDYFLTGNYFDETGWRDLSPKASGFTDPRCGSPRQFRRPDLELERRSIPHGQQQRHTVHRNHDQPGLFRQCRQYAPTGRGFGARGQTRPLAMACRIQFLSTPLISLIPAQRRIQQHGGRKRRHPGHFGQSNTVDSAPYRAADARLRSAELPPRP